jgi:hypothetical protein
VAMITSGSHHSSVGAKRRQGTESETLLRLTIFSPSDRYQHGVLGMDLPCSDLDETVNAKRSQVAPSK